MKAEYMLQIGLVDNGGIELATSKEEAERVHDAWIYWNNIEKILKITGCTRSGGNTHTAVMFAAIRHISLVEIVEAKVNPLPDRPLRSM